MIRKIKLEKVAGYKQLATLETEKHVMMDTDLAEMYQVETKVLNQAVKRNVDRFPEAFRFQLNESEIENLQAQIENHPNLKSQFVTSSTHGGRRTLPYAFTEQGVAMLSAVLRSETAVNVSIAIMNAFVQMRQTIGKQRSLDVTKANTQYATFKALPFAKAHDRFFIIDETEVYHLGASLKDLGKKWFAFSKLEADSVTILKAIKALL